MAQFENLFKVDLKSGAAPVVSLRQIHYGDVRANRVGALVCQDGQAVSLSGTCSGTAILADGTTVPMTGTVSGNAAYVDMPSACYSVEGVIRVFVKLTAGGVTVTLLAAVGTVALTETGAVIDPGTIIPSVAALISEIEEAVASIPEDYSTLNAMVRATQDSLLESTELDLCLEFEQGNINESTGANSTASAAYFVRTPGLLPAGTYTIRPNGQKSFIFRYNAADDSFHDAYSRGWGATDPFTVTIDDTYKWRLKTRRAEASTNLTPAENVLQVTKSTQIQALHGRADAIEEDADRMEERIADSLVGGLEFDFGMDFEQGNIDNETGAESTFSANKYLRTSEYLPAGTYIIKPNGQKAYIFRYNPDDHSFVSAYPRGWGGTETFTATISEEYVWRLKTCKVDESVLTPAGNVLQITQKTQIQQLHDEDADIRADVAVKAAQISDIIDALGEGENVLLELAWESGNISTTTGAPRADENTIRTADFLSPGTYLLEPDGQYMYRHGYLEDGTYDSSGAPWGKNVPTTMTVPSGKKYKIVTGKSTDPVSLDGNRLKIYRVSALKELYDGAVYDYAEPSLPSYYVENVQDAVARYQAIRNNIIGDSFCFLTDTHLYANSLHAGALLRYIGKNSDCRKVFCGGDTPPAHNSGASEEYLKNQAAIWLGQVRKAKGEMAYYGMRGNHDLYAFTSSAETTVFRLPYDSAWGLVCGANGPVTKTGGQGTMYYALDNAQARIRYICCDTSDTSDTRADSYEIMRVTTAQLQWLAATLLETPAGWSIVVLGHVPASEMLFGFPSGYESAIRELGALGTLLKDFKNRRVSTYGDFTSAQAELVAYVCGHAHCDQSAMDDGLLFVGTTCDSRSQIARSTEGIPDWTRTKGTVSEQAIDIFTVDTQNKKLYATRVGVGGYGDATNGITPETIFDREWSYVQSGGEG